VRLFVRRDLDGFFGLFIDNLVQLLLIVSLCAGVCGMTGEHAELITRHILPGVAISIVFGNLFYAWQAHRLARRLGRDDVTALPYGINTPSLIVYIFFVIAPTYQSTGDPVMAWRMGLLACLGSGIIEFAGAFVAGWIRRNTPRAALLSTLAGIAVGFISMTFALRIWSKPLIAMIPLAIVLVSLLSGLRFPLRLPGGLVAIVVGTAAAWLIDRQWSNVPMGPVAALQGFAPPLWAGEEIVSLLQLPREQWLKFLSVIVPMGLFNVAGSLQNIESAEAAGDPFPTRSSLAVNGLGTIAASLFGSCFPTTIYIGHPGWKSLGARAGYSTLNGVVIALICLSGGIATTASLIPIEAGIAIVLWIGVVITAQAFQATPTRHAPAVAVGLFPAIAAWGATVVYGAFMASGGRTMQQVLETSRDASLNDFLLHGLIVLERGYIFTCMILAAICALIIDRKFFAAAIWSAIAAALTLSGLMHAYQLDGNTVDYLLITRWRPTGAVFDRGFALVLAYAAMAVLFALLSVYAARKRDAFDDPDLVESANIDDGE